MLAVSESSLDDVAHAVADATRRRIVRHLQARSGATTTELAALAPTISRFAVMKHLEVLRRAGLVRTMADGRRRRHYLEPEALTPLRDWLAS
jgi:DNA-binding transcriptional ArsR family regulator